MVVQGDDAKSGSLDLLGRRIKYLSAAAKQLAATVPSVSHSLMRLAMCHLKDANGIVPKDQNLYLCFNCGVVRTYCINTKIRCEPSTPRQRKRCRKAHMKEKKKRRNNKHDTHVISHTSVMIYQCNLCNARIVLPGEARTLPSRKANNSKK